MKTIFASFCVILCLTGCSHQSVETSQKTTDERIEIFFPTNGSTIMSPLTVSGKARGNWFFEATAEFLIVDWDGRIIAQSYIQTESDWMTEDFVNFTGEIEFEIPEDTMYRRGSVIFQKDNPSGLSQNDAAIEIPVLFQ